MPDATRDLRVDSPKQYEASQSTWDSIAESREFKDLMATKRIFIVPAFIFFVVYYFALPVLVGYAPEFMSTKVIGAGESRLSVCPIAILRGVDHRGAIRESRGRL